jgi:hypothetical protein
MNDLVVFQGKVWYRSVPARHDRHGRVILVDPLDDSAGHLAEPDKVREVTNPYEGLAFQWWIRKRAYEQTCPGHRSARFYQPPDFGLARLVVPPEGWTPPRDLSPLITLADAGDKEIVSRD